MGELAEGGRGDLKESGLPITPVDVSWSVWMAAPSSQRQQRGVEAWRAAISPHPRLRLWVLVLKESRLSARLRGNGIIGCV